MAESDEIGRYPAALETFLIAYPWSLSDPKE